MKKLFVFMLIVLLCKISSAEVNVVTTTTVIYDIVKEIGKDKIKADYICRGDQDPHFLEILPSYMMKLRKADIVFKIGLDLEKWLPQLIDGSRNSSLVLVDLSINIEKKDVPTGKIDASRGDIHPSGNPHYWLDPENVKIMASEICNTLSDFDPANAEYYKKNREQYIIKLDQKISDWMKVMQPLKGKDLIFFHSSWTYFTSRFGINTAGYVEPKPGIQPTPSHNAEIINIIKKKKIKM